MALITIKPTAADKFIANSIAAHTRPPVEKMAQLLTWGADEKLLLALAAAGWLPLPLPLAALRYPTSCHEGCG
jgi:hypothetical protein